MYVYPTESYQVISTWCSDCLTSAEYSIVVLSCHVQHIRYEGVVYLRSILNPPQSENSASFSFTIYGTKPPLFK